MTDYHLRDISDAVGVALENMPVVGVTGMPRTGKTTFLRLPNELSDRSCFSFDDFAQPESANCDNKRW